MTHVWPAKLWAESRWLFASTLTTTRCCTVNQIKSPSLEAGYVRSTKWLWPPTKERSSTALAWSLISRLMERWWLPWWSTSKTSSKTSQRRSQGPKLSCHGSPVHGEGPISGEDVDREASNGFPLRNSSGVVHTNVGHQVTLITLSKGYFCTKFYIQWSCDVTSPSTTTQTTNKHHHHCDGAAHLSSGVDLMIPCHPSGRWPCAFVFQGLCQWVYLNSIN